MGMLDKAKKEHEKKKHPAAEAPESAGPAPSNEPEGDQEGGDSASQSDEGSPGADPAPSATPGGGPGAGGTPDAPQAGANQPTQQGSEQGDSGDSEGDDADQDQSGGDSAQGDQSGTPSGDDSDDGSPQGSAGQDPPEGEVAQDAKAAGGSLQEFKNAVGPNGEPDFSKIPLPPALSQELDKAKDAVHAALFQNPKIADAVATAVVPGDQLPSSAAHMTLVIVSSVNKKLMFSKNAPQLVLPIVQWTLNNILHMVEQVRKTQIPDQQACGALGLAQEGVMRMFGVSKQQVSNLKSHLPPSMVSKYQAHYKNAHQYATSGQQGGGQSAPGGSPPQAAQSGGPPQAGGAGTPGPASGGGGMVSQGAQAAQAQPPQGGGAAPSGPSQEETEEQQ